jgi:tryptophanyl-tRNA synthetase
MLIFVRIKSRKFQVWGYIHTQFYKLQMYFFTSNNISWCFFKKFLRADCVPVGEDQKQHIELCRDYARRFNSLFGECMVIPETKICNLIFFFIRKIKSKCLATFPKVRSLRNAAEKMSKSDKSDQSRINLTDSATDIEQKIIKAKTDSITEVNKFNNTKKL